MIVRDTCAEIEDDPGAGVHRLDAGCVLCDRAGSMHICTQSWQASASGRGSSHMGRGYSGAAGWAAAESKEPYLFCKVEKDIGGRRLAVKRV